MELLAVAVSFDAFAFHHYLNALECVSRDERRMGAPVDLAEPAKVPHIDRVLQQPM
jgi:hypothetical protein